MILIIRAKVISSVSFSLTILSSALALPSPQSLRSDLTIYSHNDLYGNLSSRTGAAIVLSGPVSQAEAEAACAAIGESLWSPPQTTNPKHNYLQFLVHQGLGGPYWTGSKYGPVCEYVGTNGFSQSRHQPDMMPAVCTNTAPLSNLTYQDNSTLWQTQVKAGNSWYTGFRDRYSFRFEGVRYAQQPERFTYSTVYNGTGNVTALEFGPQCIQSGSNDTSEDCLFLNIWTPYLPSPGALSTKLKPVMLWIHGGAFTGGTGSDPTFDGGALTSRGDVVLVTINYRLGTLGFLALNDGITNGNFGLADQITAIDWLKEYITSFGGDPNQITIFGQSAGAASVRALLGSPKAIGKYVAAIMMSNLAGLEYATTYSEYYTIDEEVALVAQPILNATGCANATSQVECLRGVDAGEFTTLATKAAFLVVDGEYLVTDELEVTGKGPVANVPVMMGFMRDDGAAFIGYPTANTTLTTFLNQTFTDPSLASYLTPQALSLFPEPDSANTTLNVFNTTALVGTDAEFRCLDEATAYSTATHDIWPEIYFYEFNRSYQLSGYNPNAPVCTPPATVDHPLGNPDAEYFKCHSGELYYVFGSLLYNGLLPRDDHDIPFSQYILDTWSSFARTFNPNPSLFYLSARGFSNTTAQVLRSGDWSPVDATGGEPGLQLKFFEYPDALMKPFDIDASQTQCETLGLPISFYESQ